MKCKVCQQEIGEDVNQIANHKCRLIPTIWDGYAMAALSGVMAGLGSVEMMALLTEVSKKKSITESQLVSMVCADYASSMMEERKKRGVS